MDQRNVVYVLLFVFCVTVEVEGQTAGTISRLENIRMCNQFSGSDAGAKIQACLTDLPSTGGVADARGLEGAQTISATITVGKPVELLLGAITLSCSVATTCVNATSAFTVTGSGRDVTTLKQSITTNTFFGVASQQAFQIQDLTITSTASGQTGGAAIVLAGAGGANTNVRSAIDNVHFLYQWIGLDSTTAGYWKVANCDFNGVQSRGIRINNTSDGDVGDNEITGSFFSVGAGITNGEMIEWIAGGGLRVIGNKFQEGNKYDLHINWNTSALTTMLTYIGNMHEPMATGGYAVYFERTSGGLGGFTINGNYFRSDNTNRNLIGFAKSNGFWTASGTINGNVMYMPSASNAIAFLGNGNGDQVEIAGNMIYGGAGAASVGILINDGSAWSGATAYVVGDLVISGGATYRCILDHTNHVPPNATYWAAGTPYGQIDIGQNLMQGVQTQLQTSVSGAPLLGYKVPDKAYFGTPTFAALGEQVQIPNATYYGARNAANAAWVKLIGQDASNIVQIASSGQATNVGAALTAVGAITGPSYKTTTNCISAASPAVCGSAASGAVAMPTTSAAIQVNTTALTANSRIFITFDQTLGSVLGVTCNSASASQAATYFIAANNGSTAFTIQSSFQPVTNPACLSYFIVN